jgi:signal transduction histidine kinase/CheY-like chemotaxis protein
VTLPIVRTRIEGEHDVVLARQQARHVAELLGFDGQDQTRVATAVSEIARNAFQYAGGGTMELGVEGRSAPQLLLARIVDRGPGIPHLREILDGQYRSPTGMGMGMVGARRLMDHFAVESSPGSGTAVALGKLLPARVPAVTPERVGEIARELHRRAAGGPLQELQRQNQELLEVLSVLRSRNDELLRLNRELDDTNRGVVALYAELDERADHLRRADELKSRFLSNMTHEFRTPVNSILALSRLLLDRVDGPLTPEQDRQVRFVRNAAEDLAAIVDDLLDLAKVEAGKTVVHAGEFDVAGLFGALRGMLRPLLVSDSVKLVFEDPDPELLLVSDETKISQILRNFISNALKYTERGEVRVSARALPEGRVAFAVADTGIGISPEDQERIFDEFTQLDSPLQRRVKGTGLGLPLCRRLAQLLGGHIELASEPGVGSTFTAVVPRVYESLAEADPAELAPDPYRVPLLVVEDGAEDQLVVAKQLRHTGFQAIPARTLSQATAVLARVRPRAILLDILLRGQHAWQFLSTLKAEPSTREIPVLVLTSLDERGKALALGADAYARKPVSRRWLLAELRRLTGHQAPRRVLVIDDEEVARYLVRQTLPEQGFLALEAKTGREGLDRARQVQPDLVFLDLLMPDVGGLEVLEQLKADPATRDIPVVVVTSRVLTETERRQLAPDVAAIVSKAALSRDTMADVLRQALLVPEAV